MNSSLTIRIIFTFSLLSALLAGGLGIWYRSEVSHVLMNNSATAAGAAALEEFARTHRPVATIPSPLEALAGGSRELIDPQLTLPQSFSYNGALIRYVAKYQETCQDPPPGTTKGDAVIRDGIARNAALTKALRWAEYLCDKARLPADSFFYARPFMHPNGRSYVALALQLKEPHFADAIFRARTQRFMHVFERNDVAARENAAQLRALGRTPVAAMLRGEAVALGKERLVVLQRKAEGDAAYEIYPRSEWNKFMNGARIELTERGSATKCSDGRDYFCWTSGGGAALRLTAPIASGALAALTFAVLGFAASGSLRWWTVKKLQDERVKMVRLLAHELRTPATSLALTVDALRGSFEQLPDLAQEAFLRIANDAERMKRVVATSARFLGQKSPTKAEQSENERSLPSIAEYLATIVEPVERRHNQAKVVITVPKGDFGVRVDPAWLELAVTNLADNALRHGLAPVSIEAVPSGKGFSIIVRDAGNFSAPAATSERTGLGFGLMVVEDAANALGAKLSRSPNPTKFMLTLKRGAAVSPGRRPS